MNANVNTAIYNVTHYMLPRALSEGLDKFIGFFESDKDAAYKTTVTYISQLGIKHQLKPKDFFQKVTLIKGKRPIKIVRIELPTPNEILMARSVQIVIDINTKQYMYMVEELDLDGQTEQKRACIYHIKDGFYFKDKETEYDNITSHEMERIITEIALHQMDTKETENRLSKDVLKQKNILYWTQFQWLPGIVKNNPEWLVPYLTKHREKFYRSIMRIFDEHNVFCPIREDDLGSTIVPLPNPYVLFVLFLPEPIDAPLCRRIHFVFNIDTDQTYMFLVEMADNLSEKFVNMFQMNMELSGETKEMRKEDEEIIEALSKAPTAKSMLCSMVNDTHRNFGPTGKTFQPEEIERVFALVKNIEQKQQ